MRKVLLVFVGMAALAAAAACGSAGGKGQNAAVEDKSLNPEMGESGTSGKSGNLTLAGCLEKNLDTGQFVLVMQDRKQPGHDRLTLQEGAGVKLNGSVGKHVTVAGTMASGKGDAFPRGYGDNAKADNANAQRRLIVSALQSVGGTCAAQDR